MKLKNSEDWISECHQCMRMAEEITKDLTDEQFNWKPSPKKWSIAECFEHLIITGNKMSPILSKATERGRKKNITGEPPYYAGSIGTWFLKGSGAKGKPMPAPGVYKPVHSELDKERTLQEFMALQEEFIGLIEESDGLDLSKIRARSAITPFLRFNAATWFQAMPGHQFRHFNQMRRVMESEGFPGNSGE